MTEQKTHEQLLQAVKDAIEQFVSDTGVPVSQTKEELEAIVEDAQDIILNLDDNGEEEDENEDEEEEEEENE